MLQTQPSQSGVKMNSIKDTRAPLVLSPLPKHGSPEDRGAMDFYYGRRIEPHKMVSGERITLTDEDEIAAYYRGMENETEQKDW